MNYILFWYAQSPIIFVSINGCIEVAIYLYKTCHADVEIKDIVLHYLKNIALDNDNSTLVKYHHDSCPAYVKASIKRNKPKQKLQATFSRFV